MTNIDAHTVSSWNCDMEGHAGTMSGQMLRVGQTVCHTTPKGWQLHASPSIEPIQKDYETAGAIAPVCAQQVLTCLYLAIIPGAQ